MLDQDTRTAALRLRDEGHGVRTIAKALGVSRNAVRRILTEGRVETRSGGRPSAAEQHIDLIRGLYAECRGNLVRVQEKLADVGVSMPYSTLTRCCRRHGISPPPHQQPAGRYHFEPGEEMQHDTSPHDVVIGGVKRRVQCASVVLCFSRLLYVQAYPTFNRFYCKTFLQEAAEWFGGVAGRCMVDNSSVVVAHGTGRNAEQAPDMKAFAARLGFSFCAHEKGDVNRSARVERPFWFVERNFYSGRTFDDLGDLNRQAVQWCEKVKQRFIQSIRAVPAELFQLEKPRLRPLPVFLPEVYELHSRTVDLEGYVHLHGNRYSTPDELLGRRVEVRESKNRVRIFDGRQATAEHPRLPEGRHERSTLPEHARPRPGRRADQSPETAEETILRKLGGGLGDLVRLLRTKHGGRAAGYLRRLHRMYLDYPTEALERAVAEAVRFGLTDLERIERMTLRAVAGEFFRLPPDAEGGDAHGRQS